MRDIAESGADDDGADFSVCNDVYHYMPCGVYDQ
jgi:hypothetical protein